LTLQSSYHFNISLLSLQPYHCVSRIALEIYLVFLPVSALASCTDQLCKPYLTSHGEHM
jgi:hypothetical protein